MKANFSCEKLESIDFYDQVPCLNLLDIAGGPVSFTPQYNSCSKYVLLLNGEREMEKESNRWIGREKRRNRGREREKRGEREN